MTMISDAFDRLDRAILSQLQADGRATCEAIGERIGLSPSAVLRRIKKLEDGGTIDRYVALLKPEALGLGLMAYVNVRLEKRADHAKRNPMDEFRASVQAWPEVVECVALTGEMEFFIAVGDSGHECVLTFHDGHAAASPRCAGLQDQLRDGPGEGHHGVADSCMKSDFRA